MTLLGELNGSTWLSRGGGICLVGTFVIPQDKALIAINSAALHGFRLSPDIGRWFLPLPAAVGLCHINIDYRGNAWREYPEVANNAALYKAKAQWSSAHAHGFIL